MRVVKAAGEDDKEDAQTVDSTPLPNIEVGGSSSSAAPKLSAGEAEKETLESKEASVIVDLDPYGKQQRPYKGTTRVPGIWVETWKCMTPKAKQAAKKKYSDDMLATAAAAAKTKEKPTHNRTLIEFCCGPASKLGQPRDAAVSPLYTSDAADE